MDKQGVDLAPDRRDGLAAEKAALIRSIDAAASERDPWKKKNRYYHAYIETFFISQIPPHSRVLEIGCGTGDLLAAVRPSCGVGIDFSREMVAIARSKYPDLKFVVHDAEELALEEKFDYVVLSCVGDLFDVWKVLRSLHRVVTPDTRLIFAYHNPLWEPLLALGQRLGLRAPQKTQNWLSFDDIENLLGLNGFEAVQRGSGLLLPKYVPWLSGFLNGYLSRLPVLRDLCLQEYVVARERTDWRAPGDTRQYSCSVIIPCKNEAGTVGDAVARTAMMGRGTELIFVDDNSSDGTAEAVEAQMAANHGQKEIRLVRNRRDLGKAHAVRLGFDAARGDLLFILDGDLTVPPEDLPKFYQAFVEGRGDLINGTRLVYPMQEEAMRSLNLLGNKMFSVIFTWLLGQKIKDTLCGTKVISRENYDRIRRDRAFFGEFDPFGDFDLLFGAARQKLRIAEIPVRYRARVYGDTKIRRFRHGWLLLKMCWVAFRKLKLAR